MALRSLWKGTLRFSLVSVPVEAFTAAEKDEGEIHLNQLHDKCHSRIRYKKTRPIHGEVRNDEIVMGYEYEKDKYVVFQTGELNKPTSDRNRSIVIDTFIPPDKIDPIYYDGRTYYLTPESQAAEQPYAVPKFRRLMTDSATDPMQNYPPLSKQKLEHLARTGSDLSVVADSEDEVNELFYLLA